MLDRSMRAGILAALGITFAVARACRRCALCGRDRQAALPWLLPEERQLSSAVQRPDDLPLLHREAGEDKTRVKPLDRPAPQVFALGVSGVQGGPGPRMDAGRHKRAHGHGPSVCAARRLSACDLAKRDEPGALARRQP